MNYRIHSVLAVWIAAVVVGCTIPRSVFGQQRALTFSDLMAFRQIKRPAIADNGRWVAFESVPDRGDGSVVVRSTVSDKQYEIPLGSRPVLSSDGSWAAMRLDHSFAAKQEALDDEEADLKSGLILLELSTGDTLHFARIDTFGISARGRWLARLEFKPALESDTTDHSDPKDDNTERIGAPLILRNLADQAEIAIDDVRHFAFDNDGARLAYAVSTSDSTRDGLYYRDLELDAEREVQLHGRPGGVYPEIAWSDEEALLAFLAALEDSAGNVYGTGIFQMGDEEVREIVSTADIPEGWILPGKNPLRWSRDRGRLFFGIRPQPEPKAPEDTTVHTDPYDEEAILSKREVDVWHWNDPRINPQQKKVWKKEQERPFAAVYHVDSGEIVQLGDSLVQVVGNTENVRTVLGKAPSPYFKDISWDGQFFDLYAIDLRSGRKTLLANRLEHRSAVSPGGRFVVYYRTPNWFVYDVASGRTRNVTESLDVSFANEDHDYPDDAPDYGLGGWIGDDESVLIYDKFDIWQVQLDSPDPPSSLTAGEGRATGRTFRVIRTDRDKQYYESGEFLLLSSYHNDRKNWGFYEATAGKPGVAKLLEEEKRFLFRAKAEDAAVYLFTREDYDEFPDLWVTDPHFDNPVRVSDLNRQLEPFAWGASELVEWTNADGIPLQGVLIRPGDYEPGKRYPVIVYFYRFMSQLLHQFNEPVVNHRPSYPLYASNGYALFLPDIRFEIGRPGFSATKAIVPGVQKLVDLGVADPNAIGLHGHSWSGYQAAFIVTQTDIFAAAVAGAPVSNMTSAYGGIRWESGLGRQFQYEKTQSRLGGSLWEARDRYIENSPLFYADRVNTPLLIQFGDEDGAVPWYQGIELYLALRRNKKDAIFLQYRGEPHHLKKYPNKLDYSIKMKEYFDHYLKGATAPKWISEGVPYGGD